MHELQNRIQELTQELGLKDVRIGVLELELGMCTVRRDRTSIHKPVQDANHQLDAAVVTLKHERAAMYQCDLESMMMRTVLWHLIETPQRLIMTSSLLQPELQPQLALLPLQEQQKLLTMRSKDSEHCEQHTQTETNLWMPVELAEPLVTSHELSPKSTQLVTLHGGLATENKLESPFIAPHSPSRGDELSCTLFSCFDSVRSCAQRPQSHLQPQLDQQQRSQLPREAQQEWLTPRQFPPSSHAVVWSSRASEEVNSENVPPLLPQDTQESWEGVSTSKPLCSSPGTPAFLDKPEEEQFTLFNCDVKPVSCGQREWKPTEHGNRSGGKNEAGWPEFGQTSRESSSLRKVRPSSLL